MMGKSRAIRGIPSLHSTIQARENLSIADVIGLIPLIEPRSKRGVLSVTCYLGSQFFDLVLEHKLLALERCNVQVVHCR